MIRRTIRPSGVRFKKSIATWSDKLKDVPAFILGNAPSLNDFDLSVLDGFFTIGLNRILYKIDPTILFWQDEDIYRYEKKSIDKSSSLKVCRDISDPLSKFFHFKLRKGGYRRSTNPSILHGRGSSGPLGVQLADAMGCNPIYLIGMDCQVKNGNTDFYGKNVFWKKHTQKNCVKGLQWINSAFSDKKIYNLSKKRDISFSQIISELKNYRRGRDFYIKRILS